MTLAVKRFIRLCYDLVFLVVRGQIVDLFRDDSCFFIYNSVRSLDETVLVDDAISRQRTDQSDVRAFRCLDRAHSSVM